MYYDITRGSLILGTWRRVAMLLGWYASLSFALVLLLWSRGLLRGRLYLKDVLVVALLAIFVLAALIIAVLSPARYDFEILRRVPKSRRVKMYSSNISATKNPQYSKWKHLTQTKSLNRLNLDSFRPVAPKSLMFDQSHFILSVLYLCFI